MTFLYAVLIVGVAALLLLGATALASHLEKKHPSEQYDERQQAARGKAYGWALLTGFAYFVVILLLDLLLPNGLQASLALIVTAGISLEAFVLGCYCIFHDAYLPLTKSLKVDIIVLYALGGTQLLNAIVIVNRMRVTLTEDGISKAGFWQVMLSANRESTLVWMSLMVAAMGIVLATLELIHYIRDKGRKA